MGGFSRRSGHEVVSSRLPREAYDELTASVWTLGGLLIPEFDEPMAPCTLSNDPLVVGDLAVEVSVTFELDELTEAPDPTEYDLTMSWVGEYEPNPRAQLWIWRGFSCAAMGRSVSFRRGATIVTPYSSIILNDVPVVGVGHSSAGSSAWRTARRMATGGGQDDYYDIVNTAGMVIELLREATTNE